MTDPRNEPATGGRGHADRVDNADNADNANNGLHEAHDPAGAPGRQAGAGGARMDRRRLLAGTAAAAAFVGIGGIGATRPWRRLVAVAEAPLAERLAAIGPWSPSVRAVGEAYLRARPADGDAATLVALLRADLGLPAGAAVGGDLRVTARQAIRRDFADRRTMRLDGWVASPTEARLAALAVVTRPTSG